MNTIFILSEDAQECARMLDDRMLGEQIEVIAQVLCEAHYVNCNYESCIKHHAELVPEINWEAFKRSEDEPLPKLVEWASGFLHNYSKLAAMGVKFCHEYYKRFFCCLNLHGRFECGNYKGGEHKLLKAIGFAQDNAPDFCDCREYEHQPQVCDKCQLETPFPLVMPDKYITEMLFNYGDTFTDDCKLQETIKSYRNYYRATLAKDAQWTRREKPNWILTKRFTLGK